MQNNKAIEVLNLTKKYGAFTAIEDVSFSVQRGEIVGFLGPNGAGKTTTLKILSGILLANSGKAFIDCIPLSSKAKQAKSKIGYMPENNPLPDDLRVSEYLSFRAKIKGVKKVSERVNEVMEICDLYRTAPNKIIGSLSKGFRQRVGIADVLLASPKIIFLDEPTVGLDPHQVIEIRKLLKNLQSTATIMLSSHILSEIEACCSQLIILNKGKIIAEGNPNALKRKCFPNKIYQLTIKCTPKAFAQWTSVNFPKTDWTVEQEENGLLEIKLKFECLTVPAFFLKKLISSEICTVLEFLEKKPNVEDIFINLTQAHWKLDA